MDKGDKTMKARIKATGEIVDETAMVSTLGDDFYLRELEPISEDMEISDYWTRLEHTYVGMFMKSFLDNFDGTTSMEILANDAIELAHALVQKMKEERK